MVSLQNYSGKGFSINLRRNEGFAWQHGDGISMKGYFFYNGVLYDRVEQVVGLLGRQFDEQFPEELVNQFIGLFSLAIVSGGRLMLIADHTRSFPLYYTLDAHGLLCVSDDFYSLVSPSWQINNIQKEVFLHSGFTLGNDTIIEGVKVLDGGQYLSFEEGVANVIHYYNFGTVNHYTDYSKALTIAGEVTENWVERLIASVKGRTLVIPLSGGYDSRYIIAMLKHKGYEKVIAYSYGTPTSEEAAVSKRVAETLGYPWIFVDYTVLDEYEYLLFNENTDFYKYAHGGASSPHVQDMMAVKYMMEQSLIPTDAVVVPGICGDVYGGSQIAHLYGSWKDKYLRQMPELMMQHICHLKARTDESIIRSAIQDSLRLYPTSMDKESFLFQFDQYYLTQKINKFVVNSCKVYEYFGLEWRLPLMDSEFSRTWLSISPKLKIEHNLYKNYLFQEVFAPLQVNFEKKKTAQQKYGWFLKYIPEPVFRVMRFFYKKKTDHNSIFQKLRPFLNDLTPDEYEKHFINPNHIFSVWALKQLVNNWLPSTKNR